MTMNPTLALRIDPDLLVYGVVAVVVGSSWIYNTIKHLQKATPGQEIHGASIARSKDSGNDQPVRKSFRGSGASGGSGSSGVGGGDLDDLAARRRRQLQELARRKRGKSSASASGTTPPTGASSGQSQKLNAPVNLPPNGLKLSRGPRGWFFCEPTISAVGSFDQDLW